MRTTSEVLDKIEDKLWKNLEELNKEEKQLIKYGNSSHYSMCHFSDSYRYISCINLLQVIKKIVDDDESYIRHYGLEEFETEEDKPFPLIVDYTINDDAEIVIDTTLGIFHIPPHLFKKMVKEAIMEGYLKVSVQNEIELNGEWAHIWEIKMKLKTEEED